MAKLTGVKTIDTVNGEITKVEYAGEVYVRVEGVAQVSDLVLRKGSENWDITEGAFYIVTEIRGNFEVKVSDDVDQIAFRDSDRFDLFRKQSVTPSSSLDERVTTLEKRVDTLEKGEGKSEGQFRKVTDREPKAGDFVKFSKEYADDDYDITGGKYYVIKNVDSDGDLGFYDDADDYRYKESYDGEIYEKVNAEPTTKSFNIGDYVKVISNGKFGGVEVGEIGVIVEGYNTAIDGDNKVINLDGSDHDYFYDRDIVHATDEEVAEAKRQLAEKEVVEKWAKLGRQPNEFKKGDIVRVIDVVGVLREGTIGEVGEYDGRYYRVNTVEHKSANWHGPSRIELIAPVESRVDQ